MKVSKPKRILHVVGAMNRAGTETMLMNVYRNINREELQFDFISYNKETAHYDEEIENLGGRVIRLNNTNSIFELYSAIKKNGPYQAVHSHTLFHCGLANIAAKIAGVKVRIAHAHTTLDKCDSFIRKMYIKTMKSIISVFSTNLLACSNNAGNYLFGEKNVTTSKYTYFPNLIDYKKFLGNPSDEVQGFKAKYGLENCIVIGHIGRFIEAKNHVFLLKILKSIRRNNVNAKLLLVGDGDLKFEIEEMVRKEGLNDYICFVGLRSDISTVLHSMDIFVFPSIYEGLGLVLLEAQACGLPCIVSEAIQPEADLGLGLFSKLSLSDSPESWARLILNKANKREKNIMKILDGFSRNHYEISTGISKLLKIYKII